MNNHENIFRLSGHFIAPIWPKAKKKCNDRSAITSKLSNIEK